MTMFVCENVGLVYKQNHELILGKMKHRPVDVN
jgi:hypothetical protein